jgi:signal transduction histidine kinase/HD-like signal output (HDOD) protein
MDNHTSIPHERSVEILLDRLDNLPSPSAVATRLMMILEADSVSARDVIELISTDPALSARVVGLCARSPQGRSLGITSLDRAVVLLGFDAVRSAALSVRLFETIQGFSVPDRVPHTSLAFDHNMFWRHSLAVGILSEKIAAFKKMAMPSSAFLAGLLHDIGHLALHTVSPKVFSSACEIAEMQCSSVDVIAHSRIGIDGRTAGRRIARNWGLPPSLVDAIWLVDQPASVIRGCADPDLVSIVALSDALMARDQVSIIGHGARVSSIREHTSRMGLSIEEVLAMRADVLEEVELRAVELGLDSNPTTELLLSSIARANRSVGRFASAYREKISESKRCETSLQQLTSFLEHLPCESVDDAVLAISESARSIIPGSSACVIIPGATRSNTPRIRFCSEGTVSRIEFRAGMPSDIARDVLSRNRLERCGDPVHLRLRDGRCAIVALGLPVGSALLPFDPESTLQTAWCTALEDTFLREQSELISESLAHANRELASHREVIARARAASAVAAIAAGAAHEINNPLAVIAGRSHLLFDCLQSTELAKSASEIKEAALEAGRIVDALSESVAPIEISVSPVQIGALLSEACSAVSQRKGNRISISSEADLPKAALDGILMRGVLVELIENALRASSDASVVLEAGCLGDDLRIVVSDGGPGFSARALQHAFEPFFSEQPSGRRRGLGLSHARRLVEAHGGTIAVSNGTNRARGARVSIHFPASAISAHTNAPCISSFAGLQ